MNYQKDLLVRVERWRRTVDTKIVVLCFLDTRIGVAFIYSRWRPMLMERSKGVLWALWQTEKAALIIVGFVGSFPLGGYRIDAALFVH